VVAPCVVVGSMEEVEAVDIVRRSRWAVTDSDSRTQAEIEAESGVGIEVQHSTVAGRRCTPTQEAWVSAAVPGRGSMMRLGSARRSVWCRCSNLQRPWWMWLPETGLKEEE
jgi:hypothetical protein